MFVRGIGMGQTEKQTRKIYVKYTNPQAPRRHITKRFSSEDQGKPRGYSVVRHGPCWMRNVLRNAEAEQTTLSARERESDQLTRHCKGKRAAHTSRLASSPENNAPWGVRYQHQKRKKTGEAKRASSPSSQSCVLPA